MKKVAKRPKGRPKRQNAIGGFLGWLSILTTLVVNVPAVASICSPIVAKLVAQPQLFSTGFALMPAAIGGLSALVGLTGSALGTILANILRLKTEEYSHHFVHWVIFAAFWIFAIVIFSRLSAASGSPFLGNQAAKDIVFTAIVAGAIIGFFIPILSRRFLKSYEGEYDERVDVWSSIKWFVVAGIIFGLCGGTANALAGHETSNLVAAAAGSGLLCGLYGLMAGVSTFRIGGIGNASIRIYRAGLSGAMLGILLGIISSICFYFAFPAFRNMGAFWSLILIQANFGAFLGTFYPKKYIGFIESMLLGHNAASLRVGVTPFMKLIYCIVIALPWGMLISIATYLASN